MLDQIKMLFKLPKETKEIHWTKHIKEKMREYQLSERRLLRILRNPRKKRRRNCTRYCCGNASCWKKTSL